MLKELRNYLISLFISFVLFIASLLTIDVYDPALESNGLLLLAFALFCLTVISVIVTIVFVIRLSMKKKANRKHDRMEMAKYSTPMKVCPSCQCSNQPDMNFFQNCGAELNDDCLCYGEEKKTLLHVAITEKLIEKKKYYTGVYFALMDQLITCAVYGFIYFAALAYLIIRGLIFTPESETILDVLFIVLTIVIVLAVLLIVCAPFINYQVAKKTSMDSKTYVFEDAIISVNHVNKEHMITTTYVLPLTTLIKGLVKDDTIYLVFPYKNKGAVVFYSHEENDPAWEYLLGYVQKSTNA